MCVRSYHLLIIFFHVSPGCVVDTANPLVAGRERDEVVEFCDIFVKRVFPVGAKYINVDGFFKVKIVS